jgi:hypothetical protein
MSDGLREAAQEMAFEWYGAREPETLSVIHMTEMLENAMRHIVRVEESELLAALRALLRSLVGDEFADDIPAVVGARAAISRAEERRQ